MEAITTANLIDTPYWSQPVPLAQLIAETLDWHTRNPGLAGPRLDAIDAALPRGSGIDIGTVITRDWAERSPDQAFRLHGSWHAMDQSGMYAGWFDFAVIVEATFSGPAVSLEWLTPGGQNPEQLSEEEYSEANDADADEWFGVSDPSDYLIDVYSEAMRETYARSEFDSPPMI